ncbi:MAG: polymer-forming cytoskeletal protein [Bacteroidia bacterium]
MFGGNKNNENNGVAAAPRGEGGGGLNTISSGTVIVGNINAEGDMRIEGKVVGTIVCNSRLVVSATGMIEGSIDARNAIIEGEIKGDVITRELLQIDKTGKVFGDVFTQKLVVQMGAIFTGNCKMGDAAKDMLAKTPAKPQELLGKK